VGHTRYISSAEGTANARANLHSTGGSLAGVGFALAAAAHLLRSLLFEVSPHDPLLVSAAVGMLLCAGIVACLLPASRAAAVDPMTVLRAE
jgi:ABC-type lipoprotein release transport system permease subunit